MKKTLFICAFALVLSVFIPFSSGLALATATDTTEATTHIMDQEIFNEYYNNGTYERRTSIYLNPNTDYSSAFHGNPKNLIKTTYFKGNSLFMDDGEWKINSGYTSYDNGPTAELLHYQINSSTGEKYNIVSYGDLGDINNFFVTMDTFRNYSNEMLSQIVSTDNGITYETTNKEILKDVMAFVASCYTNGANDDYLTLTKAVFKIVSDSETSYLKINLYVDTTTAGNKLTTSDGLLATALILKGNTLDSKSQI